ncbi:MULTISPECIES: hypothetical protein [Bacillales]|uniref:Uncharacterized protein n=1 Tax=Lysinibacillus louembei TaxID=1470088 RepID=A0ABZ0RYK3_9BACI|nr:MULTISPECIES: hypothetical protein [Bacillales]WPK13317.1 hypothetical protein R6U77_06480 [Lysinibacillus louembei]
MLWIFGIPFFVLGIANNDWTFIILGITLSIVFYFAQKKSKEQK